MADNNRLLKLLLWIISILLIIIGVVSGGYGIEQISSTPLFGAIFLFLAVLFLYNGYRFTKNDPDDVIQSIETGLTENRMELYLTIVLSIISGILYLTGTFTIINSIIRVPKIQYSYPLLMAFLWPVIGTENIVYILTIYSKYTFHLPFMGPILKIVVIVFEMIYLFFISKVLIRMT